MKNSRKKKKRKLPKALPKASPKASPKSLQKSRAQSFATPITKAVTQPAEESIGHSAVTPAAKPAEQVPEKKTADQPQVDKDDSSLFRDAVGEVKPVAAGNRRAPDRKPPKIAARMQHQDDKAVMRELMEDFQDVDLLETGEHLAWTAPGIQRSELRKLKSGKYTIQSEIDLHGLTRQEAKSAVAEFLFESLHRELRCVRIIHGRGRRNPEQVPVLKRAVDNWLCHHKQVLAYCSARESDGGTGAVYVLLRRVH